MRGNGDIMINILVFVILNIVTYLLSYLLFPIFDLLGFSFLLLNVILVPAFFCAYVKRFAESSEVSRKRKKAVILSSVFAMIAVDIVACIIKFQGIMVYYMPAKGVWYLICGIWALLNYHLDRPSGNKKAAKILTSIFATVSLMLNGLLFFPFTPWYELIMYEVFMILPFLLAFISMSSYLIGKMVSKQHRIVKSIAWLLAIVVSVLSLISCFGEYSIVIFGICLAVIMFGFYIVGMIRQETRRKR